MPEGRHFASRGNPSGDLVEAEPAEPGQVDHGGGGGHGNKAVIAALLSNLAIAIAKFIGFLVTNSGSLLAESVHSGADTGNQALLLLGGKRAKKQATPDHPFGYGRERYFWAFIVALVLFSMGSMFALYEAFEKIRHPHEISDPIWAFGILGFAIIAEGFSFRTAIKETRSTKGDSSYIEFIRKAKVPELPVVLLEDLAALLGLLLAVSFLAVATVTGDAVWDGYGTLSIGILLGVVAIILAWEMKSLLIGESASRKQQETIRAAIEVEPGVLSLIHMRTEHLGPDELLVCAKVEFDHEMTLPEVAETVDRVERNVRANVASARLIYIEPDVTAAARIAPIVMEHGAGELPEDVRERLRTKQAAADNPRLPPAR